MRHLILMLTLSIFILSCGPNENKEQEAVRKGTTLPEKKITIDTAATKAVEIKDSEPPDLINYIVKVRRSYLFTSPDMQSKTREFLLKDKLVGAEVPEAPGNFVQVTYRSSSGERKTGWLLFSDLEKVLFVPPVVVKDSE